MGCNIEPVPTFWKYFNPETGYYLMCQKELLIGVQIQAFKVVMNSTYEQADWNF